MTLVRRGLAWASRRLYDGTRLRPTFRRSIASRSDHSNAATSSSAPPTTCNTPAAPRSESAATRGSAAGLMTRLQEAWSPGAQANVILNDDPESDFKHIELEEERIRLEFQSTESPVYQGYARAWAGMQMNGDRSNGGLENAVVDIKNNTFCGAGATVFLCREKVTQHLAGRNFLNGGSAQQALLLGLDVENGSGYRSGDGSGDGETTIVWDNT